MRSLVRQYFSVFLKGMAMGAADVVPGVSGGTVAFISGIYEQLINSIAAVNVSNLRLLLAGRFLHFWYAVNGTFLAVLFSGILLSIVLLANLISTLLVEYPLLVWSFFFGLILASSIVIARSIPTWNKGMVVLFCVGVVIALWISGLTPQDWSGNQAWLFFSGAIAICAMILPGISGSFILLLLGMYSTVLGAVRDVDLAVLGIFCAGCVCGLLTFAKALHWLFGHYRFPTLSLLTGFLLGSLSMVWPWKQVAPELVNQGEKVVPPANLLPWDFASLTDQPAATGTCILLALGGVLLVLFIEHWAARSSSDAH